MRLLVIGGIAAGLSAAARARRLDPGLEIVVLEKGDTISYGACGLPFYLDGRVHSTEELIVYTPEYFRKQRNITVRTGAHVISISHPRREVLLKDGERIRYDRMVIATGARPRPGSLPGSGLPHVFRLHTIADAVRLKRFLDEKQPRRAAVIGAGFIGLEVADALRRNGLRVTVFEMSGYVLHREDAEFTRAVCRHMQRFQVELRCGVRLSGIEPDRVEDVPCDLVVLSLGIQPNVEIAADAGVEIGRTGAIRVDDRMETNVHGIFAAGDCAEVNHLLTGRPAYLPLGTTANKMGRVAGANAAGARERFAGVVGTSILALFGVGIGMTGFSVEQARREGFSPVSARIEAPSRPSYFGGKPVSVELVADRTTRRLIGGTVMGEHDVAGRTNVIASALHNRMKAEEFAQLDLAYSPPFAPVWDPLLVAAQQLTKLLD